MFNGKSQRTYSTDFLNLIQDKRRASSLIEGSFCSGQDFKGWVRYRAFISTYCGRGRGTGPLLCENREGASLRLNPIIFDNLMSQFRISQI